MCRRERTTEVRLCAQFLYFRYMTSLHINAVQNKTSDQMKQKLRRPPFITQIIFQIKQVTNSLENTKIFLRLSFTALRPVFRPWSPHCRGFETVALRGDVSPMPNPQPGAPGYLSLPGT